MKKKFISALFLLSIDLIAQQDSLWRFSKRDTTQQHFNIPLFNTLGDDTETQPEQQDISSLLQSSRDVFVQFASFQFGNSRYRIRGLDARNQLVHINGLSMNSPETGSSSWSSWGGLNDVTRYAENRVGNTASRYGFSGAGGYTNIDSRASSFKKGQRVSYMNGNRTFRHRVIYTQSTGLNRRGWAATLSASIRTGNEVYVPGTYFFAGSVYLAVDKKINSKHLISFTSFAAPMEQGRKNAAQKESYDLSGDPLYNSAWGYQAGKVRNAHVGRSVQPTALLAHVFDVNADTKLNTTVYYLQGRKGNTGINRFDAPNPKPDYYRYLPSYYYLQQDSGNGDRLTELWRNPLNRQINWDRMIQMNQANLYSDPAFAGQQINTTETRARYIVEEQVEKHKQYGINLLFNQRRGRFFLSGGIHSLIYRNHKFKQLDDLLGADFWIDVDQFAENLGAGEMIIQNDIDHPNRKVREGERFGYSYLVHMHKSEAWTQVEFTAAKTDWYLAGNLTRSGVWREGLMANGKFPNSSKGVGTRLNFNNAGIKSGITFKLSGRHFVSANGTALSRTPNMLHLFVSPRVRQDLISDPVNEVVMSGDLNYTVRYPGFKMRLSYFNTQINNQVWLRTFWHDSYNANVNLIMRNVDQNFQGVELGLEKSIFSNHLMQFAFSGGQFMYTNRPLLEAWQDNNNMALFSDRKVYLKNYFVGGTPQLVCGVGYRYNDPKRWFAGLNMNYAANHYVEPNPDRRTAEATEKFTLEEKDLAARITTQEKLPAHFLINCIAGKSFRLSKKHYLNTILVINNLLNKKDILVNGFEQLRWDRDQPDLFPSKYNFMNGTNYMTMISLNF